MPPRLRERSKTRLPQDKLNAAGLRRSARLRSTGVAKLSETRTNSTEALKTRQNSIPKPAQSCVPSGRVDTWLEQTFQPKTNSRKRNRASDPAEEEFDAVPLTKRNLRILEAMGKTSRDEKSQEGKRGHRGSKTKSSSSRHRGSTASEETGTKSTKTTKSVSTTEVKFPKLAWDNGVLPRSRSRPPANIEELRRMINCSRGTASPPESQYEDFVKRVDDADNEMSVLQNSTLLFKQYAFNEDLGYDKSFSKAWTEFPKNVGFNNGLSAPQPDMLEGLREEAFRPFPVEATLGGAAVLTTSSNPITLPHLAGEFKGPGKDTKRARVQASYDGAAMVFARSEANRYLGASDPAGHAVVTTFTTDGSTVDTWAHYSTPVGNRLEYHQYPISHASLTTDYNEFKTARRQLRNLQDYAKEKSLGMRNDLVNYWSSEGTAAYPANNEAYGGHTATSSTTPSHHSEPQSQHERATVSHHPNSQIRDTHPADHDEKSEDESYQFIENLDTGPDQDPDIRPPSANSATYVTPPLTEPARRRTGRRSEPHQTKYTKHRGRK